MARLDGTVLYYISDAELREKWRMASEASDRRQKEQFEANRDSIEADIAALPPLAQQHIRALRANPDIEPEWKWLSYEVFILQQAAVLADTLGNVAALEAFKNAATWDDQRAMVPGLSDGHSGFTFDGAVAWSRLLIEAGSVVDNGHASSEGYGEDE